MLAYGFLVDSGRAIEVADRLIEEYRRSERDKLNALKQIFGTKVPLHLFYDIGRIAELTYEDIRVIEEDFFDGEEQPTVNIELHVQRDGNRHLRIKRGHYRRLYATIRGVDYPLVLAADYPEGRSVLLPFVA